MIVTLCGSVRFEREFKTATMELGLRGIPCFSLSVYPSDRQVTERGAGLDLDYDKVVLDLVHQEKILRSDAILVVGDGYVGRSTAREILWADMMGKRIVYRRQLWETTPDWDFAARAFKEIWHNNLAVAVAKIALVKGHATIRP